MHVLWRMCFKLRIQLQRYRSWINVCFNENQAWVRAERVYAPKKAIKTATVKLVYKRAGKAEFKEPFFETVIHRPAKIDPAVGEEWQKIGL